MIEDDTCQTKGEKEKDKQKDITGKKTERQKRRKNIEGERQKRWKRQKREEKKIIKPKPKP